MGWVTIFVKDCINFCFFFLAEKAQYVPEKEPTGFFPGASTARHCGEGDQDQPPIKADCYVPNSILLRLLWPPQAIENAQKKDDEYRPPGLTEEQMKQIAALNKKVGILFSEIFNSMEISCQFVAFCFRRYKQDFVKRTATRAIEHIFSNNILTKDMIYLFYDYIHRFLVLFLCTHFIV